MKNKNRKSKIENGNWLPDMDLNHDKQLQSLLCYRYTIGQRRAFKLDSSLEESRFVEWGCRVKGLKRLSVEVEQRLRFAASTLQPFNAITFGKS